MKLHFFWSKLHIRNINYLGALAAYSFPTEASCYKGTVGDYLLQFLKYCYLLFSTLLHFFNFPVGHSIIGYLVSFLTITKWVLCFRM